MLPTRKKSLRVFVRSSFQAASGTREFAIWSFPSLVLGLLLENIVGCQLGVESNRASPARLDDHDQSGRELEAKTVGF